jgi:uncharacterized protein (TIGR04255 family)
MFLSYSRAPVSEVIIGMNYKVNKMSPDALFKAGSLFSEDYPDVEILAPLIIEELKEYRIQPISQDFTAGPFLIRRRTKDHKWLLQIQSNKVYLNWIRLDTEAVGNYIGFSKIKEKYFTILDRLGSLFDIKNDVLLYEVSYHDRFEWQNHISDISKINTILNISSPPLFSKEGYNNIFSKFTYHDPEIGGYGFVNINTDTSPTGKQLLRFESNIRGMVEGKTIDEWLCMAHEKQLDIFEKTFTEKLRQLWK